MMGLVSVGTSTGEGLTRFYPNVKHVMYVLRLQQM